MKIETEGQGANMAGAKSGTMPLRERITRTPAAPIAAYALLALLQVADVFTTAIGLPRGGIEVNPINAWLYMRGGWPGLLVTKAVFLAVVGAGIVWQWRMNAAPRYAFVRFALLAGLALLCMLVALTIAGNLLALARLPAPPAR